MTTPPQPTPLPKDDDVKWLALLIRQGLKLIVVGIERRYGLCEEPKEKRAA